MLDYLNIVSCVILTFIHVCNSNLPFQHTYAFWRRRGYSRRLWNHYGKRRKCSLSVMSQFKIMFPILFLTKWFSSFPLQNYYMWERVIDNLCSTKTNPVIPYPTQIHLLIRLVWSHHWSQISQITLLTVSIWINWNGSTCRSAPLS